MSAILKDKKVLITGGAGFIGSNLCDKLLGQNNNVVCLDDLSTGHKHNIEPYFNNPKFTFIEGDIRDIATCEKAVDGVDVILHQAALGSVPRSIKDPQLTNSVNITGFINMLTAAKNANVKRFVYAASSSTYGNHPGLPKVEDEIGAPLSPYAVTKYVNELYANVFADLYGIEVIGLRYFNVFGRRQDPNGAYAAVIPKFVDMLIKHESPVINGDGSQTRDFTYIDNVVQANELAATTSNPKAVNTVYNVAFGDRIDLNDLTKALKENLSKFDAKIAKIEIIHGPTRLGDIPHSLASIDKAKSLLNYNPKFSLQSGLNEAIDWYWNDLK